MGPSDFKTAWTKKEQNLQAVSYQTLHAFGLDNDTFEFLLQSGLPSDAAPFLSFVGEGDPTDLYSRMAFLTAWFGFLEPEFRKYIAIGSDGSGDIIAINTAGGFIIEWLDHEDRFSARFVNSSVGHLADSLLCYRDFIDAVNGDNTDDNDYDTDFTDEQFDTLHAILESIDHRAVREGFWKEELDFLLENREEARNKQ